MSKYILTIEDPKKNNAGPKAKEDILYFLEQEGFERLPLKLDLDPEDTSFKAKLHKLYLGKIYIPRVLKKVKAEMILLQYPIYSTYLTNILIATIRKYTDAKLYLVIHDVETLRLFKDDHEFVANELQIFNEVDGIIDHNKKMHAWLQAQGIKTPIVDLGLFDYHNPIKLDETYTFDRSVVFAGNLEKSKFLTKLAEVDFQMKLFGPNPATSYPANAEYLGVHTPEELPKYLTQNFGLVWDGTSLTECDGIFGEYTKYNDPHKASLYLSSGLPIIVWQKAAIADFVITNNLGFAVESLHDISKRLETMNSEEYSTMKKNAVALAEKLRRGYFIKTAVAKLTDEKDRA